MEYYILHFLEKKKEIKKEKQLVFWFIYYGVICNFFGNLRFYLTFLLKVNVFDVLMTDIKGFVIYFIKMTLNDENLKLSKF